MCAESRTRTSVRRRQSQPCRRRMGWGSAATRCPIGPAGPPSSGSRGRCVSPEHLPRDSEWPDRRVRASAQVPHWLQPRRAHRRHPGRARRRGPGRWGEAAGRATAAGGRGIRGRRSPPGHRRGGVRGIAIRQESGFTPTAARPTAPARCRTPRWTRARRRRSPRRGSQPSRCSHAPYRAGRCRPSSIPPAGTARAGW